MVRGVALGLKGEVLAGGELRVRVDLVKGKERKEESPDADLSKTAFEGLAWKIRVQ